MAPSVMDRHLFPWDILDPHSPSSKGRFDGPYSQLLFFCICLMQNVYEQGKNKWRIIFIVKNNNEIMFWLVLLERLGVLNWWRCPH